MEKSNFQRAYEDNKPKPKKNDKEQPRCPEDLDKKDEKENK